jgi:hypothetical protein
MIWIFIPSFSQVLSWILKLYQDHLLLVWYGLHGYLTTVIFTSFSSMRGSIVMKTLTPVFTVFIKEHTIALFCQCQNWPCYILIIKDIFSTIKMHPICSVSRNIAYKISFTKKEEHGFVHHWMTENQPTCNLQIWVRHLKMFGLHTHAPLLDASQCI